MNFRFRLFVIVVLVAATLTIECAAQDTHYWTHHYGTRATLLGGAVIGSVLDLSEMYYNPGALALLDEPEIILAAKVFESTNITVKDGLGEGLDLDSPQLSPAPRWRRSDGRKT